MKRRTAQRATFQKKLDKEKVNIKVINPLQSSTQVLLAQYCAGDGRRPHLRSYTVPGLAPRRMHAHCSCLEPQVAVRGRSVGSGLGSLNGFSNVTAGSWIDVSEIRVLVVPRQTRGNQSRNYRRPIKSGEEIPGSLFMVGRGPFAWIRNPTASSSSTETSTSLRRSRSNLLFLPRTPSSFNATLVLAP